jgi:hypothetical protein
VARHNIKEEEEKEKEHRWVGRGNGVYAKILPLTFQFLSYHPISHSWAGLTAGIGFRITSR